MGSQLLETAGRFIIYSLLLLFVNFLSAAHAADIDGEYRDAALVFEKRDMASTARAVAMLEKVLEQKPDHIDAQALVAFAYAHEAFVLTQMGEKATDYQNSADAFAKAVQAQQPENSSARKATLYLQLMSSNAGDARKTLEKVVTEKETDADLWYMLAIAGDADKSKNYLGRALAINSEHVWIYTDMAFRALKLGDTAIAEKWITALEAKRPSIPEIPLLHAVVAAQKKDKKRAQEQWAEFARRMPDSPLVLRLNPAKKK